MNSLVRKALLGTKRRRGPFFTIVYLHRHALSSNHGIGSWTMQGGRTGGYNLHQIWQKVSIGDPCITIWLQGIAL